MDSGREPMLDMFIFETLQLSDQLEQLVLNSEKSNSFAISEINEIFRIMHTIKGSAAMMLFNSISVIAHGMEDLFYFLRESESQEMDYSRLCDLVLDGIDFIKGEVNKIEANLNPDGVPDHMLQSIEDYLMYLKSKNGDLPQPVMSLQTPNQEQKYYISSNPPVGEPQINQNNKHFKAVVFFEEGCEMENIRAFNIIHKMKDMTNTLQYLPADIIENNQSIEKIRQEGFKMDFTTECCQEDIEKFFLEMAFVESLEVLQFEEGIEEAVEPKGIEPVIMELKEKDMEPDVSEGKTLESINQDLPYDSFIGAEKEIDANPNASSKQNMISVQLTKLDKLLDLVGELVISGTMVTGNPDLRGIKELDNFNKAARQHRKVINELQDIVMSIRMVPLTGTFQKMNRIVRDMSKKLGKQVSLNIRGEETEVDKNIIEHLSDPLMHLIRNAIDHGIESADDRLTKGKPPGGNIFLEAKNEGGDVWITIKDDGAGMNREKILRKAFEHGLVSKMDNELSDQEVYAFILLPGFSTKSDITEFSGRGVGMDVVAKNIEDIGGAVYVDSSIEVGTTISLKIPLTLAIIDGLGIRVGNSIYTVPITSIRESFKAKEGEVFADPDGNEMIMVRGDCFPILRLHELYRIRAAEQKIHEGIIMMAETDTRCVCLFADELLGEQQVVVKALPKYLKKIKGIGGCTLLGDGRSSLILDVAGLINH